MVRLAGHRELASHSPEAKGFAKKFCGSSAFDCSIIVAWWGRCLVSNAILLSRMIGQVRVDKGFLNILGVAESMQ